MLILQKVMTPQTLSTNQKFSSLESQEVLYVF